MVSLDLSVKHIVSVLFCNTIGVDSHILVLLFCLVLILVHGNVGMEFLPLYFVCTIEI